jgi:hypothetical protein
LLAGSHACLLQTNAGTGPGIHGSGCQRLRLPELLRPDERLAELRLLPRALARSLCARLFWLLARAPLLEAWARLLLRPEDDLPDEEELRDAIACSFE